MIEATSCGGVVIFRGKILVLIQELQKQIRGLGSAQGDCRSRERSTEDTALREVREETGVSASIIKYIGKSQLFLYTFPRIWWKKMYTGI